MATIILYAIYIMSSYYYTTMDFDDSSPDYRELGHASQKNMFHVGGISGARNAKWLLWVTLAALSASTILWVKLVWINPEPGIINTRREDFEEVLNQSMIAEGEPPADFYCRTTLIQKPMRSKYCVKTGAVVARMDHYCIWLNITVGFGNHRSFILLLVSHFVAAAMGIVLTVK
jgi:hypothetical protein